MDYKHYKTEDLEMINEEILDVLVQRLIDGDEKNLNLYVLTVLARQYGEQE